MNGTDSRVIDTGVGSGVNMAVIIKRATYIYLLFLLRVSGETTPNFIAKTRKTGRVKKKPDTANPNIVRVKKSSMVNHGLDPIISEKYISILNVSGIMR